MPLQTTMLPVPHRRAAGGMLEVERRAAMPAALYCLLSAYCLEAVALVYATVVVTNYQGDPCYSTAELAK